jgi:hypothetical protein
MLERSGVPKTRAGITENSASGGGLARRYTRNDAINRVLGVGF